jgi:hypothetical protein
MLGSLGGVGRKGDLLSFWSSPSKRDGRLLQPVRARHRAIDARAIKPDRATR